jgi:hypothetical protein
MKINKAMALPLLAAPFSLSVKLFLPLNFDNTFDNSLCLKTFRDVPKEK